MEENKEKTDDPSDHHGGINTMDKVTECLDALIEEMRESRAYQNYLWMEEKLEKRPDLKAGSTTIESATTDCSSPKT